MKMKHKRPLMINKYKMKLIDNLNSKELKHEERIVRKVFKTHNCNYEIRLNYFAKTQPKL